MPAKIAITLRVNGQPHTIDVWPMDRLLDVLRLQLGLTGTKEGCGEGECGSCAVIMDGRLATSCLVPALAADGADITTIEGLRGDPLQNAFLAYGGTQCGFCTPGMILAAKCGDDLNGNLCRCTGYAGIHKAMLEARK